MRFLEFLKTINEDIPVGPLKNKELWLDYLKKNFKTPDGLFVTFVSVDKVGLNPKSPYDTPIGVYTYPLDYVLNEEDVPFRGETKSSKIKVLKRKTNKILTNDLTDYEYELKIKHIENLMKNSGKYTPEVESETKDYIKRWEQAARKNTNFGCLWNVTRMLSMDFYSRKNASNLKGPTKNNPVAWTKLLLELGYDLAIDYDTGTIHPSEPTQAVFLNPNSYKVVGEEFVDTEERYKTTQKNNDGNLIDSIIKGGWTKEKIDNVLKYKKYKLLKISTDDDISALGASIRFQKEQPELFEKVIPYFQKDIKEHFVDYFNVALSFLKANSTENAPVDYFLNINDNRMYTSGELPSGKILRYLKRTTSDISNKKEMIKRLEKESDESLSVLEDALKDVKKVGKK
jgi:hypothetical protein